MEWKSIGRTPDSGAYIYRTSVPGGWLVLVDKEKATYTDGDYFAYATSITFCPDPEHKWNP